MEKGSGIGKLMAIKFAKLGSKVSLVDINFDSVQKIENDLKLEGYNA